MTELPPSWAYAMSLPMPRMPVGIDDLDYQLDRAELVGELHAVLGLGVRARDVLVSLPRWRWWHRWTRRQRALPTAMVLP